SVLKSASDLVELDIQSCYDGGEQEPDRPEELECSSCYLSQLQTVNISVGTSCVVKHFTELVTYGTSITKSTR
ncbi:hypothetical protein L195_g043437, partial [Trifolium pratense]